MNMTGALFFLLLIFPATLFSQENILWKVETQGRIYSSPLVDGDRIFVGSGDHSLYAIQKNTGEVLWTFKTGGPVHSSPCSFKNIVYIASADGNLYAIEKANGKLLWSYKSGRETMYDLWDYYKSSAKVSEGIVYWGSGDGKIYAFDCLTGKLKWTFSSGSIIRASPVIYEQGVYFGNLDGYFYSVHAKSGKLNWKFRTIGDTYFPKGEIQQAALAVDGTLYFGSRDFNIYALDAKTGRGKWNMKERGSWIIATPFAYKENIYFGTSDTHTFYCMNKQTGNIVWKLPLNMRVYGSAVAFNDMIFFGCFNGKLYGVDHLTGEIKWEFQTRASKDNYHTVFGENNEFRTDFQLYGKDMEEAENKIHNLGSILSTPVIDGGIIYFGSSDRNLYAVRLN